MAGGWGHAIAAAVGGYQKGAQYVEAQDDREEERAFRNEQRDRLRRDDAEQQLLKKDLRSAAQPVAIEEGTNGMLKPESADNRDLDGTVQLTPAPFRVNGQSFADRGAAEQVAAAQNAPAALAERTANVYAQHGLADKSIAVQEQQMRMQQQQAVLQRTAVELKNAGVMDAITKFRLTGDPLAAKTALSGAGFAVDGDITVAPVQVDVPGLGKINAYQASFQTKGPDGKAAPVTIDTHQATMAMMPYEKALALLEKGAEQRASTVKTAQTQSNWVADRAAKQDELAVKRAELAEKGKERETTAVDKRVNAFATQLDKSNIPQFDALLSDIEGTIAGLKDIPGYGASGALPAFVLSEQGKVLRQKISQLQNLTLKDRSGAAVTNQELGRLLNELGTGTFSTDDQLRTGLGQVRRNLDAAKRNFIAGVDDAVLNEYQTRGGMALHRGTTAPESAGAGARQGPPDRASLESEMRKRGLLK